MTDTPTTAHIRVDSATVVCHPSGSGRRDNAPIWEEEGVSGVVSAADVATTAIPPAACPPPWRAFADASSPRPRPCSPSSTPRPYPPTIARRPGGSSLWWWPSLVMKDRMWRRGWARSWCNRAAEGERDWKERITRERERLRKRN